MGRSTRAAPIPMSCAPATDLSPPSSSELARLRELLRERRFNDVVATANAVLAGAPGQRDALLFAAIAQRFLGQIPEALKTLATLEQHHPGFSRLFEERGRCFVALRQAAPAIEAFEQALRLNYALPG